MLANLFLFFVGLALAGIGAVTAATAPIWFALGILCVAAAALRWQRVRLSLFLVSLGVRLGGRPVPPAGAGVAHVPPDIAGLPDAAAAIVRRTHDAIDAENERWQRSKERRTGPPPSPLAPAPVSTPAADVRAAQFRAWDTGRAELIREGEAMAEAMRALPLRENEDGLVKDLAAEITDRRARTWVADVDAFEDFWFGGQSLAPGYLRRLVAGFQYQGLPAPKPGWRQKRVREVEHRLDRLRQRSTPPKSEEPRR